MRVKKVLFIAVLHCTESSNLPQGVTDEAAPLISTLIILRMHQKRKSEIKVT